MSELTKLKIFICFNFYCLNFRRTIDQWELDSLCANVKMLLKSSYIFDIDDFSSELRKLYLGSPTYLYNYVNKFIKYLNKFDVYTS